MRRSLRHPEGHYSVYKRALDWPTTIGKVTLSKVIGRWDGTGETSSYMYSPQIEYQYKVSGVAFTGNRYCQCEVSKTSSGHAESVVSELPVNSEVEVYYHPKNPSKSMLESAALTPMVLTLFLVFGSALLVGGAIWLSRL